MINKKIVAIIAVGILLVTGIYFLLVPSGTVGESPWGETGDYGLTGVWKVTPYAVTTDGERIPIVSPPTGFWVKTEKEPYGQVMVRWVEYEIQAQASRNMVAGAYDSVQVDATSLKMELQTVHIPDPVVIPGITDDNPTHYAGLGHFSATGFGSTVLTFESGEATTPWTTVAIFSVPSGIQTVVYDKEIPLNLFEVIPTDGPWDTLGDMTLNWRGGMCNFNYIPSGIITIQGLNSEAGDGTALTPDLPAGVVTHTIVGQYTTTIDWNSQVTYT